MFPITSQIPWSTGTFNSCSSEVPSEMMGGLLLMAVLGKKHQRKRTCLGEGPPSCPTIFTYLWFWAHSLLWIKGWVPRSSPLNNILSFNIVLLYHWWEKRIHSQLGPLSGHSWPWTEVSWLEKSLSFLFSLIFFTCIYNSHLFQCLI